MTTGKPFDPDKTDELLPSARPMIDIGTAPTDPSSPDPVGIGGSTPGSAGGVDNDGTPPTFRFFKVSEFDCHDGSPYPTAWVPLRLAKLVGVLDLIRERWGGPLVVVSGYRTIDYNRKIGGAKLSQHCEGRAADIRPRPSSSQSGSERCRSLHALILRMWNTGELPDLGGLGVYPEWVHVDVRDRVPSGHLAEWTGAGIGSEVTG